MNYIFIFRIITLKCNKHCIFHLFLNTKNKLNFQLLRYVQCFHNKKINRKREWCFFWLKFSVNRIIQSIKDLSSWLYYKLVFVAFAYMDIYQCMLCYFKLVILLTYNNREHIVIISNISIVNYYKNHWLNRWFKESSIFAEHALFEMLNTVRRLFSIT